MELELAEALWPDDRCALTLADLARCTGLSQAELRELVDRGALVPIDARLGEWTFAADVLFALQAARRLRDDLELDAAALALALTLLRRVRELENELRALRAAMPHAAD